MAATEPSDFDPPEILHKLELLKSQKILIADLTASIEAAQLEYDRLSKEILAYRAALAPIQKCPEEILVAIFKNYVGECAARAANLLPVCRRWYNTAVNCPTLWDHILVRLGGPQWDLQTPCLKAEERIIACLRRSDPMPLHIALDMRTLESEESRFIPHLCNTLKETDPYFNKGDLEWRMRGVPLPGVRDLMSSISSTRHVYDVLSEFFVMNDSLIQRCKFLSIFLPKSLGLPVEIWRILHVAAPNVLSLTIGGVGHLQHLNISRRSREGSYNLTSLIELRLNGQTSHFNFLGLNFESLKNLHIRTDLQRSFESLGLSRFVNLEQLEIYCMDDTSRPTPPSTPRQISLPRLITLTVQNYSYTTIVWEVPVLEHLKIRGYGQAAAELPDVQALSVVWEDYNRAEEENAVWVLLQRILAQYTQMLRLTIPVEFRSVMNEVSREYIEDRELPEIWLIS